MPSKLTNLVITKVALVDEGSCSDAHIQFYKRREGGNKIMDFATFKKGLSPEESALVDAEIEKAKNEVPEGFMSPEDKKKLEDDKAKAEQDKMAAEGEVAKLKAQLDVSNATSDEDILKNANLDPAVKAIVESTIAKAKAAEASIMKMQEQAENTEFLAKAKTVSLISEAETKVFNLLKSVKGVPGAADQLMEILASANSLIEKGAAFSELGSSSSTGGSGTSSDEAWAVIEKKAGEVVVKGLTTKAQSIDYVCTNYPELYTNYVNAMRNE